MGGIFFRNTDLFHQNVIRAEAPQQSAPLSPLPGQVAMVWDDIQLTLGVSRALRTQVLQNVMSISIQPSLIDLISNPNMQNMVLAVRDGGIGPGIGAAYKGFEVVPGQIITFSIIDEWQNGKMVFIDPTQFWVWFNINYIVPGFAGGAGVPVLNVHIGYGVLTQ